MSDFAKREVSAEYGVLNKDNGMDARTTFVIDKDGKIVSIHENADALDPTGAADSCSRTAHKTGQ